MNTHAKPVIPESFYAKNLIGTLGLISFTLTLFLLPSWAAYTMLFQSAMHPLLAFTLSIPLFFLAGQGMHLMGWIGHDGLHFNLHANRLVSSVIGVVGSSPTGTFVEMGMALDHWTHHRYTNLPEDPDLKLFESFHGFWQRALLSRAHCNRHYVRRVYKLAMNLPLDRELQKIVLPFNRQTLRNLAWLNLSLNAFFILLYLAIAVINLPVFLVFILAPMITASLLSGMRPYIEHNGTTAEEYANTRSRTHWLWTILDCGGNFHHEHHLYPSVPQWRLPKLHRYLKAQGYEVAYRDPSFLEHYKFVTARYQYPSVANPDQPAPNGTTATASG